MTQQEIIDKKYKQIFTGVMAPWTPVDITLSKKREDERQEYYLKAIELRDNVVFQKELEDAERVIVSMIAELDTCESVKFTALKMFRLFVRDSFKRRINDLASRYKKDEKVGQSHVDNLKNRI